MIKHTKGRKGALLLFCLFLTGLSYGLPDGSEAIVFKTDSIYECHWNASDSLWEDHTRISYYINDAGLISHMVYTNISTDQDYRRAIYEYHSNGLPSMSYSQNFENNTWKNYARYLFEYYNDNKRKGIITQFLVNSQWVSESKRDNYQYDENDLWVRFDLMGYSNNTFYKTAVTYLNYDSNDLLQNMTSLLLNGDTNYLNFYQYNEFDKLAVSYSKKKRSHEWIYTWKDIYEYDGCGNLQYKVRQSWIDGKWVNQTKSVYYVSLDFSKHRKHKIPVCHNGHTIFVSKNAVSAHLAHGDCIGECLDERKKWNREDEDDFYWNDDNDNNDHDDNKQNDDDGFMFTPRITVYPNPFKKKVTITIQNNNGTFSKVELVNIYGATCKSAQIHKNQSKITLSRGNLKQGIYFMKLTGKTSVVKKVIIR